MAWNGLGITALYLGVASAARDWLTGFLTERTPTALGRPLATLPRFISAVGEIEASLTAAADLVNGLARAPTRAILSPQVTPGSPSWPAPGPRSARWSRPSHWSATTA